MLPAICVAAAFVETGEADDVPVELEVLVLEAFVRVVESVRFEAPEEVVGERVADRLVLFVEDVLITVLVVDGMTEDEVLVTIGV
jgi:hypothetical protein